MNTEAQELVKQYITETLKDVNGVSKSAFEMLELMMKVDRNLASHLHDIYIQCTESDNRYFIQANDYVD